MASALPGLPSQLGLPEGLWRHHACEHKAAEERRCDKPGRDERHRGKHEESDRRRCRGRLRDYPHGDDGDQPCPYRGDGGDQPYPYQNRPKVARQEQHRPAAAMMIFGHSPQAQDRQTDRYHGTRSQSRVPVGSEARTQPRENHDCVHREERHHRKADGQQGPQHDHVSTGLGGLLVRRTCESWHTMRPTEKVLHGRG